MSATPWLPKDITSAQVHYTFLFFSAGPSFHPSQPFLPPQPDVTYTYSSETMFTDTDLSHRPHTVAIMQYSHMQLSRKLSLLF